MWTAMLKTEPSPARSGSVLHPPGGRRPGLASICTATTSPIPPDMITCRASRDASCQRVWKLMPNVTPASRQASTARLAAGAVVASGFSQKTYFPARAARATWSAWRALGVAMSTASTSGRASIAS